MSTTPAAPSTANHPPARSAMAQETEARYRRTDSLNVGDAVPPLEVVRLAGGGTLRLDGFVGDRPLVLIFGSCT